MTWIGASARIAAISAALLGAGLAATARAQVALPSDPIPWWVGQVFITPGGPPLGQKFVRATSPDARDGRKFELLYGMHDAQDPWNPADDVIAVNTWGGVIGAAVRNLPAGTHITALDGRINLNYFFPARSCDGGSPRVQLAFDLDGDGDFDANALGYVGRAQYGLGCVTGAWDSIDMTDDVSRWDLSWMNGGLSMTWDQAEALVAEIHPNHRVLSGALVDDSSGFAWAAMGEAYYDHFTLGDRTLEHAGDTVP